MSKPDPPHSKLTDEPPGSAGTASGAAGFEPIVMCHAGLLYKLARQLCGDGHEAEDVVQETLMRAFRAFDRFDLREYGAKPWLLKILYHVIYSRSGRAARRPNVVGDADIGQVMDHHVAHDIPDVLSGDLDWDGFDEELKRAVNSLPGEYRDVLLMWALGDLTYREIGEIMDCPIGTVMSRLFRARKQLATTLADYAPRTRDQSEADTAASNKADC